MMTLPASLHRASKRAPGSCGCTRASTYCREVQPAPNSIPILVVCTGPPGTGKSTIASAVALRAGATVLGWDWAMGALTWCAPVQGALESLDRLEYRRVGWSLLWNLAEAQLRLGHSVVLDGVARSGEVSESRDLAQRLGARCVVVLTACEDRDRLRHRVEGRDRSIPGWHELTWDHVVDFLDRWEPPDDADVFIDTSTDPVLVALVDRIVALGTN